MNRYYSGLLEKHGMAKEAVAYKTPEQQNLRYASLVSIEPISSRSSVLDVGCGLGHLRDYLRSLGWKGPYTGVDINPDLITAAEERLPEDRFLCADILEGEVQGQYDYVFCGATMQHKPKFTDPQKYLRQMIETMFSVARRGLAFDIFSDLVDYKRDVSLYLNPVELLSFCYGLTNRLALRNDLRPYEIVVFMFKDVSKSEWNIYSESAVPIPTIVQDEDLPRRPVASMPNRAELL